MAREPSPSQLQDRFMLRLPDGMRDRIAEAASDAGRSMNAEIVQRLQWSFEAMQLHRGNEPGRPMTVDDQWLIFQALMKSSSEKIADLSEQVRQLSNRLGSTSRRIKVP